MKGKNATDSMPENETVEDTTSNKNFERYASQVDAALSYAAANLYDYGPGFSKKLMTRNAVDVVEAESGTVRVFIEYRLDNEQKNAGLEYVDVSPEGSVLARRQVKTLQKKQPWFLIGVTAFSIICAAVLIPLFFSSASEPAAIAAGRVLWVRIVEDVRTAPELHFRTPDANGGLADFAVRPTVPGNNISYVRIAVINQQESAETHMIVDEDAATLLGLDGVNYSPIDVGSAAVETEINQRYVVEGFQHIWGSVTLPQGFQIQGYLLFETPPGAEFSQLRWRELDVVTLLLE